MFVVMMFVFDLFHLGVWRNMRLMANYKPGRPAAGSFSSFLSLPKMINV